MKKEKLPFEIPLTTLVGVVIGAILISLFLIFATSIFKNTKEINADVEEENCSSVIFKNKYIFQIGNSNRTSYSNEAYIINEIYKEYEQEIWIN